MSSVPTAPADDLPAARGSGLWALAWRRLRRHRTGMVSAAVVLFFLLLIVAAASGLVAAGWDDQVAVSFAPPSWAAGDTPAQAAGDAQDPPSNAPPEMYGVNDPLAAVLQRLRAGAGTGTSAAEPVPAPGVQDPIAGLVQQARQAAAGTQAPVQARHASTLLLGADKWGRSVALKVVKGAQTSVLVGIAAAVLATLIGTLFGAAAGYLGGVTDAVLDWLYGVFTAIPYLLLVFAIAAVLQQKGVLTIVLILGTTGWTGVYRLVRAEYLRHKGREYVLAARALGASHLRRMFVHILPNTSHVILVQLSQAVVSFIKAEVILSFLGFGVPVDVVSWGSILNEAASELVLGKWWQMAAAATAMAVLVTAFAMFTDALRDALDPRLR